MASAPAQFVDLPSDVLAKIFTEHDLDPTDMFKLDRVCKATRAALRLPGLTPFIFDMEKVPADQYPAAIQWLQENMTHVGVIKVWLGSYTTDDWRFFMDLFSLYHKTGVFPKSCRVVVEDHFHLIGLRYMSMATTLPPIHHLTVAAGPEEGAEDAAAVCRALLRDCHRFEYLEMLIIAPDISAGASNEEPTLLPVRLPSGLRILGVLDSGNCMSEEFVMPPSLQVASFQLTPRRIASLPALPNLYILHTLGTIEAHEAAQFFAKTPGLASLESMEGWRPLLIQDLPLAHLPRSLVSLHLCVTCADTLEHTDSTILQLPLLEECHLVFCTPFQSAVVVNEAICGTRIKKLVIHSRAPVLLPDLSSSRLVSLEVHAPHVLIQRAGSFALEFYPVANGRLYFEPDEDSEAEESSEDEDEEAEEEETTN